MYAFQYSLNVTAITSNASGNFNKKFYGILMTVMLVVARVWRMSFHISEDSPFKVNYKNLRPKRKLMSQKMVAKGFGLIIIGSEILDGRVQDSHFANTRKILAERNHSLIYSMTLVDEPSLITEKLKWAMSRREPFFCCGGIGATPDDYTRQCAADASGVTLAYHEKGLKIMERRFGKETTPERLKLIEFPEGAQLIPNPVNQVPGFSISNGYFLPGFPSMAEPMMAWILDTYYERGKKTITRTLILAGTNESQVIPLMHEFNPRHPGISLSSLPKFVEYGTEICLGLTGNPRDVEEGITDIIKSIESQGMKWEEK